MTFTVIDTKTGQYPDTWEIACKEEWAKCLCYCDIEGFAVEEDGTLVLLDECGKVAYCPEGRFRIIPEPQWIPVSEQLPKEIVLAHGRDGDIRSLEYSFTKKWWEDDDGYYCDTNYVTHWMPLPEPPKEET